MGKALGLLLLLCLPSYRAFADDLVFSGSLERVTDNSISIRLDDRIVIEARLSSADDLSARRITAHYKFGDRVQLTCARIQPVWDEASDRFQFIELKKIRLMLGASAGELSSMRELPAWREQANMLERPGAEPIESTEGPSASHTTPRGADAEARQKLERAREVNLDYAANLPNFVADETAQRYTSDKWSTRWRHLDTIVAEVTFRGDRPARDQIRRDGRKWDRPFQALPGFKWSGGFGAELAPLFDLQCPTRIAYEGPARIRGHDVLKYSFDSPADGCFSDFYFEYQRYDPARRGHVFIDGSSGNVIQLDEDAMDFPAEFAFVSRHEEVSWDSVKIGDTSHLLPVAATFVVANTSGKHWRVEVEYRNHRHFESSTNVTFH